MKLPKDLRALGVRAGLLLAACVPASGCTLPGQAAPATESAQTAPAAAPPAVPATPTSAGAEVEIPTATVAPPTTPASSAQATAAAEPAAPLPAGTKPFDFAAPVASATTTPGECAFAGLDRLGDFRVLAAGAYSGKRLNFPIDDSGNQAGRFDVAVNHPQQPVVLMLGGYDPAVWHVGWTPGTRIVAVLVGGYHAQFVTGLPKDVPVLVSTYDNRGPCGYFYVSAENARTLNPIARKAFNRNVDMMYLATKGKVVVGEPLQGQTLVTDASAREDTAFQIADSQAGGEAGLDYAVAQGWLREARQSDMDAWLSAYARLETSDVPPIAGGRPAGRMRSHNAYVVLKAFRLPPGLYGAHSATFIVPKGVARPTGELGHSTLYDYNTMTCKGTTCDMD